MSSWFVFVPVSQKCMICIVVISQTVGLNHYEQNWIGVTICGNLVKSGNLLTFKLFALFAVTWCHKAVNSCNATRWLDQGKQYLKAYNVVSSAQCLPLLTREEERGPRKRGGKLSPNPFSFGLSRYISRRCVTIIDEVTTKANVWIRVN